MKDFTLTTETFEKRAGAYPVIMFERQHKCGHLGTINAWHKRKSEREAWATAHAATTLCQSCWEAKHPPEQDPEYLRKLDRAKTNMATFKLPQLIGENDYQIGQATIVRDDLLLSVVTQLVKSVLPTMNGQEFVETIVIPARNIDRASFWLDNYRTYCTDVAELVLSANENRAADIDPSRHHLP